MRVKASIAAGVMAAILTLSTTPAVSAAQKVDTKEDDDHLIVRVERGDTLSDIAKEYDTTYERIFYANTKLEDPHLIFPDQKLRIPDEDEKLKERELPGMPVSVAPPAPVVTTAPRSAPAPSYSAVPSGSVWDRLAQCESGGNWSINTGNGFYGGLQFTLSSWQAVGGTGYPHEASRDEQIMRAEKLQAIQGWGAWPACSAKLGLR